MRTYIGYILVALLITGCGGKKSTSDPEPDLPPAEAVLLYPEQNSLCITGLANGSAQSTVTLSWNAAANAQSYTVTIKNLISGTEITQTSTQPQLAVQLAQATPFSWYVTSKSGKTTVTAKSATWKFYNAGPGAISYAPFPADNLQPGGNQTVTPVAGKITLSWQGNDTDNDIVDYDVYLGSTVTPQLYKANNTSSSITGVEVANATKYYWKVITRDSKGNTSTSDVAEFRTNN